MAQGRVAGVDRPRFADAGDDLFVPSRRREFRRAEGVTYACVHHAAERSSSAFLRGEANGALCVSAVVGCRRCGGDRGPAGGCTRTIGSAAYLCAGVVGAGRLHRQGRVEGPERADGDRVLAGREVYVAEKSGVIKVFPSVVEQRRRCCRPLDAGLRFWDRGLLGLAVDPRLGNGGPRLRLRALHARRAARLRTPPVWNDDCPTTPGRRRDGCVVDRHARAHPGEPRRHRRRGEDPDQRRVVPAVHEPLGRSPRVRSRRHALRQRR